MEKAAMRMELVQDAELRAAIGTAITENRRAIHADALRRMQEQRMGRLKAMASPTRLAIHNASFEAMAAAVSHFDSRMKLNNELADIVNPKVKQAEEERLRSSEEYKEEQAYLRLVDSHQKRMAKRQKDKEQRELNEAQLEEEDKAANIDKESVKESQSKCDDTSSIIVPTVKEPVVLQAGQAESQINKSQEQAKKEAPKLGFLVQGKPQNSIFKVQQPAQEKKASQPWSFFSTFKPNQESKSDNQQPPQQNKAENLFFKSQKSEQKTDNIFATASAIPPSKIFQSGKPTTNTQKIPELSLFASGPSKSLSDVSKGFFDAPKPAESQTSLFGPNLNTQSLFGGSANTNNPITNVFLAESKKPQNQVDEKSSLSNIFTQNINNSSNVFSSKIGGSNFSKSPSSNQRVTDSMFTVEPEKKKPAQPSLFGGFDNVNASRDYSTDLFGKPK